MSRTTTWRKALALPAVLSLSLGGALLAAAPASAAEAGLTVVTPAAGSTVDSRTVEVSGSVFGGSTVIVYDAEGDDVLARTNVVGSRGEPTPYSLVLPTYADDAPVDQTIVVGGLYGGSGIPQQSVTFDLPAAAPEFNFAVTSPADGAELDSRTVVFTGTGTDGSTVNVLDTEGNRVPGTTAAVVVDGQWTTTGAYTADADVNQTVTVNQTTGGAGRGEATVSFVLPSAAPEFNFAVTAPTDGAELDSRTVVFTGTGTDGSTVNVLDTEGDRVPGTTAAVVVDGQWTTTGTYSDDAAVDQTVNVNQVTGGAGRGEATVSFTLPAVVPAFNFTVTSPLEGEIVATRTVTFTGTGTDGATVNVLDIEGNRVPGTTAAVVVDGEWTTTGTYTEDADVDQTVVVNQVIGGAGRGEITRNFELPAELLAAPVITSPSDGETVVGDQVTFTGTGEPGANVLLLVVPTDLLEEATDGAQARAAEPADPTDPIVVDENGDWTVTLALVPDDYTAAAILIDGPETGLPISEPSEDVAFTLVAAEAAAGPGASDPGAGDGLAVTGSETAGYAGLAGVLLLAGAVALIARKRSTSTN